MSQYDEFKLMIDAYLDKYDKSTEYRSSLHETSYDDANGTHLYESTRKDIEVINMDSIAKESYRSIRFPESRKWEDSISTNDAFVIGSDDKWYFIEFKDQKLNKTKDSVSKKAYSNWYMLLDMIYEMEGTRHLSSFQYEDPIKFARDNVILILVVSEDKNPNDAKRIQDSINAGQKYVPEFMKKLQKYIYYDVFLHTPATFERMFVKKNRFALDQRLPVAESKAAAWRIS